MRKTVAVSLDRDLVIKTKMHLLTEKEMNFSYFVEDLINEYFSKIEKQSKKEKAEVK